MPGEWYAPTQPFPLDARGNLFQYDRNGFARDDLIDFTPELRAEGEKMIARYKIGPIFTPPVVSRAEGPLGTLQMAVNSGGTVWAGGSYDPETRIMYVYSRRSPGALGLVKPDPAKNDMNYVQGNALTGARASAPMGAAPKPPVPVASGPRGRACRACRAGRRGGGRRRGRRRRASRVRACRSSSRPTAASAPSAWTRARSCGRLRTVTPRTASGTIPR